jgi:hypothetical protein
LKQQRAHDVPAIYRTKNPDDQTTYKTEPNTPTHHATTSHGSLATSKSDPTPLNSALSGAKYVFDDTKKAEKTSPYKRTSSPNHAVHNGNTVENNKNNVGGKYIQEYVKPKSPVKGKTGILSHDNVPSCNANGLTRTRAVYMNGANENNTKGLNGVKGNRTITWNKDVPMEKMTFTMRREIDKAREETDLINQLRNVIRLIFVGVEEKIKNKTVRSFSRNKKKNCAEHSCCFCRFELNKFVHIKYCFSYKYIRRGRNNQASVNVVFYNSIN